MRDASCLLINLCDELTEFAVSCSGSSAREQDDSDNHNGQQHFPNERERLIGQRQPRREIHWSVHTTEVVWTTGHRTRSLNPLMAASTASSERRQLIGASTGNGTSVGWASAYRLAASGHLAQMRSTCGRQAKAETTSRFLAISRAPGDFEPHLPDDPKTQASARNARRERHSMISGGWVFLPTDLQSTSP